MKTYLIRQLKDKSWIESEPIETLYLVVRANSTCIFPTRRNGEEMLKIHAEYNLIRLSAVLDKGETATKNTSMVLTIEDLPKCENGSHLLSVFEMKK